MSRLKIKLTRNLRKTILRGHPWVYREAVGPVGKQPKATLCQVLDAKGEELAWAMYDPHCPLSLRILSLEKAPPSLATYEKRFAKAYALRKTIQSEKTNAYRLFNGEGDYLPGLVCDVYGNIAVVQFDGEGPSEFWDKKHIAEWLLANTHCQTVIEKMRRNTERTIDLLGGEPLVENEITISENGALFRVNLEKGQKTGFFLDQRDNRNYVRQMSEGKSVLNLFSYSGGFSIYAGLGKARKVASLDIAKGAIDLANENWRLNGLDPENHTGICMDVFEYLQANKSEAEMWDHIIVDPPSMGHSEDNKAIAFAKYVELFTAAAKRVKPQGEFSVSSCSSHIAFDDFFEIINEALSAARRKGQILRVSGQGADHPFPHICKELRYLKYVHLTLD